MSNYHRLQTAMKNASGREHWPTQIYIQITGDHLFGLVLDRIVWWSDKGGSGDGWFYKDAKEWEWELNLSYAQITRARKVLQAMGFIRTKKKKVNGAPTLHYWANIEQIEARINQLLCPAEEDTDDYAKLEYIEIEENSISEKGNFEIEKIETSLTEQTTEQTYINYFKKHARIHEEPKLLPVLVNFFQLSCLDPPSPGPPTTAIIDQAKDFLSRFNGDVEACNKMVGRAVEILGNAYPINDFHSLDGTVRRLKAQEKRAAPKRQNGANHYGQKRTNQTERATPAKATSGWLAREQAKLDAENQAA